jgi:hypothetical protein
LKEEAEGLERRGRVQEDRCDLLEPQGSRIENVTKLQPLNILSDWVQKTGYLLELKMDS